MSEMSLFTALTFKKITFTPESKCINNSCREEINRNKHLEKGSMRCTATESKACSLLMTEKQAVVRNKHQVRSESAELLPNSACVYGCPQQSSLTLCDGENS